MHIWIWEPPPGNWASWGDGGTGQWSQFRVCAFLQLAVAEEKTEAAWTGLDTHVKYRC